MTLTSPLLPNGGIHPSGGFSRKCIVTLAVGITFGFSFAYLLLTVVSWERADLTHMLRFPIYDAASAGGHNHDPHSHEDLENVEGPSEPVILHSDDEFNTSVAQELAKRVRVLCWVMTSPSNHRKKAIHVANTWGRRCNVLLFMSSAMDPALPNVVALNVSEGRDHLWRKTKEAFAHVYEHYRDRADWFMKADDDTYVVVENLRYMLSSHKPSEPIYFGCKFKPYVNQGYMSGGAGYVLSREALNRFATRDDTHADCRQDDGGAEDVEIGRCLQSLGVEAGDSRDAQGRGRFFPFVPEHHLIPGHVPKSNWFWSYIYYPMSEGMNCCSDSAVSFHYISPNMMYVMEYLIYHLKPYGVNELLTSHHILPDPTTAKSVQAPYLRVSNSTVTGQKHPNHSSSPVDS